MPNNTGSSIIQPGSKKTIQPLEHDSKPDLNALLAKEDAKAAADAGFGPVMTAPAPIQPSSTADTAQPSLPQPGHAFSPTMPAALATPPAAAMPPQPQTPPTTPQGGADPNNIAL